ncbi:MULTISPECIES: hypothetical protein [unclassified Streptomyces]|uniref:hypothetical protein n=1 Tax=unclassified Streptomyces TaxID=2593676 RepID=UPI002DDBA480|nr:MULTISPECIES: hypothetical protein [unclassified Streptomyces]WSB81007.1 hypothetical protein OHB04_38455 [Streptomyces sp. NBC_01775]WSS10782.1 hypothetical protein OG533_01800 [Streptomyces sp. NBC_01186]WSS39482.1 hypothetical protein OG220_01845 [Streptomyces sp. NBC_01187]
MSGMPNFGWPGDAGVKRQTVGSVISEGVYHVSELHDRAVALYGTATLLHQQVTTQIDALRSRRTDGRSLAAGVALLTVITETVKDSDEELEKLLSAADAQAVRPELGRPGTLPLDIAQTLNGYGGGMVLGQLAVRLGLLARHSMLNAAAEFLPSQTVEELPAALDELGVTLAEPTAEEATAEVAEAFGAGAMETLSGASVAAAGLGFLVTAGLEIGLSWISAKKNAGELQAAIDDYQKKIDKLTGYLRVATTKNEEACASIRRDQQLVNGVLSALAKEFGPIGTAPPPPDEHRVAETLVALRQALRHYGLYAEVRIHWQRWRNKYGEDSGPTFVEWYDEGAPEGASREQINSCLNALRSASRSFARTQPPP